MLARKLIYKQQFTCDLPWYRVWVKSVAADISFIRRNDQHGNSLFRVLLYRLFWAAGYSSILLPRYWPTGNTGQQ
jgi:hypothetical protein